MLCSREFVRLNKSKKDKKIVNISSLYGIGDKSSKGFMSYGAAKAAMNNFTINLSKLVAPNILVNAIAPGYVKTPIWDGVS